LGSRFDGGGEAGITFISFDKSSSDAEWALSGLGTLADGYSVGGEEGIF